MPAANARSFASFAYPGLVLGLTLFTALIAYQGVREVRAALAVAGFGLIVVALFHLVPMLADALGWRRLLQAANSPSIGTMFRARWIGESVNGLLPVAQVGGNVVKVRLLVRRGVPAAAGAASVVVDVTLVVLTQIIFTLIGLALLVVHLGGRELAPAVGAGLALMSTLLGAFYLVQRRGLFGMATRVLERVVRGTDLRALSASADAIDAAVRRLYHDRRTIIAGGGWHLVSWLVGAGEVWLALYFLGQPVGWLTALLLESLGQAVRAGAFAIPGALGVQEGGYLLLGRAVGLAPETSLALSLSKRVREIVLGVPGLIAWQLDGAAGMARAGGGTGT